MGWYYLHENGDLIYKPSPDAIMDIRESDFCKAAWPFDSSDRESCWGLLVMAGSIDRTDKKRVKELAEKWKCDDADAEVYAERLGVLLSLDGSAWCATRGDFDNLAESPAGFGDTCLEAMSELCKRLDYRPDKLGWGAKFKDLVGA